MHKAYAKALVDILHTNTSLPAQKKALKGLKAVLATRGHLALSVKIAREAKELLETTLRRTSVRVTVAKESDAKKLASVIGADAREFFGESEVEVSIDQVVVGGHRLEGAGKTLDRTHRRSLIDLYDKLTT